MATMLMQPRLPGLATPTMRRAGVPRGRSTLLNGLISWWELDESSGIRHDRHGTNHLTDNNTVAQAAGVSGVGNAALFTAANSENLSIADNAGLSINDCPFSVCAWCYLDSKPTISTILAKRYDGAYDGEFSLVHAQASDRFLFWLPNGPSSATDVVANSLGSPSLAAWYLVVAWYDAAASTINIQVNNGTVDSAAKTGTLRDSAGPFRIGGQQNSPTSFFDGRIARVGVWRRALTAPERAELWNNGAGISYPFAQGR